MYLFLLLVAALAIVCAGLIWFFFYADANVLLILSEKYGKSVASLHGQVAWISGAGSGLGEHLAYEFASSGVKLVLSDINQKAIEEVKNKCLALGVLRDHDVFLLPMDVSDFDSHEPAFKKVLNHFRKLDILVNNAGRSQDAVFQDISVEVHKKMFDINVFSHVNLTRVVLPHFLEKRSGHIMVTSSFAGKVGMPYSASYTGAKHALIGFFECLRSETFDKGVKVTIVCPGPVSTKIRQTCYTGSLDKMTGFESNPAEKKLSPSRAAHLMATAIANNLDEVWFALQPFLCLFYLGQYTPTFFRWVVIKIMFNENRIRKLREGK